MTDHGTVYPILVLASLANAAYGAYWAVWREEWAKGTFFMALAVWVLA